MKTFVLTFVAAGAALSLTPASAQWGPPSPYGSRYASPYGRPALGGCASGHCPSGGCSTGACAGRCGCAPGLCETGRCGADCDMAVCGGSCRDGNCGGGDLRPGFRPRPNVDPAQPLSFDRRFDRPTPGGFGADPFMAGRTIRANW